MSHIIKGNGTVESYEEWEAQFNKYAGQCDSEPAKDRVSSSWRFGVSHIHGLPAASGRSKMSRLVRNRTHIRRDGSEDFYLTFLTEGSIGCRHYYRDILLKPGEFYLHDSTQPMEMIFDGEENDGIMLGIPRSLFLCQRNDTPAVASKIDGRNPLFASLKNLIAGGENLDQESIRPEFVLDLIGMAFGPDPTSATAGRFRNDRDRVEYMTQIIDRNSTDNEFSIDHLAFLTGRSRRQIQRDLKATGTSITRLLQDRRLRYFVAVGSRAKRLGHEIRVSELAYMSGFGDQSHFNRVFREHFGMAPKSYLFDRI